MEHEAPTPNPDTTLKARREWYTKHSKSGTGTSKEDVLQYMLDNPEIEWHWSWDFIGKYTKSGRILSHRAPARASDLAIQNPNLVKDESIGRFKVYRLRWENLPLVLAYLHGPDKTIGKKVRYKVEFYMDNEGVRRARKVPIE